MATQSIVRQYKRCLTARASPQGIAHRHQGINEAQQLAMTYSAGKSILEESLACLLYTSPSPRDTERS
eukprot:10834022-Karenia_brevis.AAC.1